MSCWARSSARCISAKGRDLFDLYVALTEAEVNTSEILQCYNRYMAFSVQQPPTYKQFVANMEAKMADPDFLGDTRVFLRPERQFDPQAGYEAVRAQLIDGLKK